MRRPSLLGAAVLWLVVVAAASGLTWSVIDAAGRDVLTSGSAPALPTEGVTTDPSPEMSPVESPPASTPAHRARRPERRSKPPTPAPSTTAPPAPSTVPPSSAPPAPPPPEQPAPTRAPDPRPAPQPAETRTWQGASGTVTARCVGPRISLVSTSPANGWRVQVAKRGPEELEVEFERSGDREGSVHVEGRCGGGVPRFGVEADS